MTFNEGTWDRAIRVVIGLALGYVAWITWPAATGFLSGTGMVSLASLVIGVIAFITGVVGWCPLYALVDVSTKTRAGA